MSLTFAIADLHGRADLLEAALAAIEARVASGTVVFLGDDVDRGPKSKQVIARLVAGPSQGWEWVCLRGNHEEMMLRALTGCEAVFIERKLWMSNGGDATLRS
ncbi:metallophosphoesterase [Xanthobacter sp. V4C-4]|uniref:metallophosphoesterase n=1 Tax=Xanthobacter cornucopiae TaxID=3119924 RepID=UPI00372A5B86